MRVLATSRKHLKVYINLIKLSIQQEMSSRFDFVLNTISGVMEILSFYVFIDVLFNQFTSIGGWNKNEMIIIFGFYILNKNLFNSLVFHNLKDLSGKIAYGELDQILSKPINSLLFSAFHRIRLINFLRCFIGIFFINTGYDFSSLNIDLQFVATLILTEFILGVTFSAILLAFFSLSFWFGDINHGFWVFSSLSEIAKLPGNAFRGLWKIVFNFILPFTLFGAIPAMTLIHNKTFEHWGMISVTCLVWVAIGVGTWKLGLRSYTSAGG